jgi:4-hydroxy-tetrahydrodipicolinate reductase
LNKERVNVSRTILSIGIHGASGRMGTRLIQLIAEDPGLKLAAALVREGHPDMDRDAGTRAGIAPTGVLLSSSLPSSPAVDVMIDFSLPPAVSGVTEFCLARKVPLVVGTTGLSQATRSELEKAAAQIPILAAPNMSKAVNLLMKLVGEAALSLGSSADVAIIERHHKTKKDAPSGTALRLAECAGRGNANAAARLVSGDPGAEDRARPGEIAIHALRMADCPGEHTVVFGLPGETVELSHRALNRDGFVRGALDCAKFLAGKPAGMYTMNDVLGY